MNKVLRVFDYLYVTKQDKPNNEVRFLTKNTKDKKLADALWHYSRFWNLTGRWTIFLASGFPVEIVQWDDIPQRASEVLPKMRY